jgi:hypothetical protein
MNTPKKSSSPQRQVRSFSFTQTDLQKLEKAAYRLSMTGRIVNLSETIRVGIDAILKMPDKELEACLERVPRLSPGPMKKR